MTKQQTIILRKTPIWFIKWLCIIELIFAVPPLFLASLFRLSEQYNTSPTAGTVSYALFVALTVAFLQIVIVTFSFVVRHIRYHQIDPHRIVHKRANLFEDRPLIDTQTIEDIQVRRGPLATRPGYGMLALFGRNDATPPHISDISMPDYYAELIREMIEPLSVPCWRLGNQPMISLTRAAIARPSLPCSSGSR